MATFCAWLASCVDWSDSLSIGETGRVMFVAPATYQATVISDYCRALFRENELLASLIQHETQDELQLKRRITFTIQAACTDQACRRPRIRGRRRRPGQGAADPGTAWRVQRSGA